MSNFIGIPPFSNSLWVGIETMQFHIAQTKIFLRTPSFPIQGDPMNNLAPMKICPGGGGGGVQRNLNWMPGYTMWNKIRTCKDRRNNKLMGGWKFETSDLIWIQTVWYSLPVLFLFFKLSYKPCSIDIRRRNVIPGGGGGVL